MAKIISITDEGIKELAAIIWWGCLDVDLKYRLTLDHFPNTRMLWLNNDQICKLWNIYKDKDKKITKSKNYA